MIFFFTTPIWSHFFGSVKYVCVCMFVLLLLLFYKCLCLFHVFNFSFLSFLKRCEL